MKIKTRKPNSTGKLDLQVNKWIRLLAVSALILAFLPGCSHRHIQQAEHFTKNKKYEDALEHYFKALKTQPDDIELKIKIDGVL
ncbi:MAG: hypothetical protein GY950_21035, partial [bacterium]|nr:hypothetical protein [bacterium]